MKRILKRITSVVRRRVRLAALPLSAATAGEARAETKIIPNLTAVALSKECAARGFHLRREPGKLQRYWKGGTKQRRLDLDIEVFGVSSSKITLIRAEAANLTGTGLAHDGLAHLLFVAGLSLPGEDPAPVREWIAAHYDRRTERPEIILAGLAFRLAGTKHVAMLTIRRE